MHPFENCQLQCESRHERVSVAHFSPSIDGSIFRLLLVLTRWDFAYVRK